MLHATVLAAGGTCWQQISMRSRCRPQVIPSSWLRLFSPREVNQLLGGGDASALDIDDMQAHTVYRCWGGGTAL